MHLLPALDSASFDAHLPLQVQLLNDTQCSAARQRETRLALRVLAAPSETPEEPDPMLMRLEAKLDLALEIALLGHHPDRPALTPCRLGLDSIAWLSDHPWRVGDAVQIALTPNPDSALILFLAAHIEEQHPTPDESYAIIARLQLPQDEQTQPLWERWVFRRHRRAILER
ncbi:hypothetical protein [Aquitalea sp. ASV11]|uniref:hypothetical protein n=1 Tax=Aquitalea sp. ASV11 TaxID=2795103 RepID=UPI0018EBBE04|nr:hypothetical protein [Aquitalea sp. ASV11]